MAAVCSWPSHFDAFFLALQGAGCEPQGHGSPRWKSRCPAHEDSVASLSVGIGRGGQLLLKCHAPSACRWGQVVKALGLQSGHLWPDGPPKKPPASESVMADQKWVKNYDYQSATGELLFSTQRFDPKNFRQRRPNPAFRNDEPEGRENPQWLYNMEGVERVIYKLPELLAAWKTQPGKITLCVEGEKDCDLAWGHGIAATTNPMGALKWTPEQSLYLAGQNVVVIPDEDPVNDTLGYSTGIEHAMRVCESLQGVAKTVKFLRLPGLPPKGDLSDWWALEPAQKPEERKLALAKLIQAAKLWMGRPSLAGVVGAPAMNGVAKPVETPLVTPVPAPVAPRPVPIPPVMQPDRFLMAVESQRVALNAEGVKIQSYSDLYGALELGLHEIRAVLGSRLTTQSPKVDRVALGEQCAYLVAMLQVAARDGVFQFNEPA